MSLPHVLVVLLFCGPPALLVLLALVVGVQASDNRWNDRFEAERQAARADASGFETDSEAA